MKWAYHKTVQNFRQDGEHSFYKMRRKSSGSDHLNDVRQKFLNSVSENRAVGRGSERHKEIMRSSDIGSDNKDISIEFKDDKVDEDSQAAQSKGDEIVFRSHRSASLHFMSQNSKRGNRCSDPDAASEKSGVPSERSNAK